MTTNQIAPPQSRGGPALGVGGAIGGAAAKPKPLANRLNFACLVFGGGTQYDISQFIVSANWTDSFDAPAMEIDLQIADPIIHNPNSKTPKTIPLRELVRVGMGVRCFADSHKPDGSIIPMSQKPDGTYKTEFFRGYIFGRSIDASTSQDMLQLTCYDQLIYLAKNDLDAIYKDVTATEVIQQICDASGIKTAPPGQSFQDTKKKIKRLVSYGNSLYDVAYLAIQKTWMLTGGLPDGTGGQRYRLRSENGVVTLRERLQSKNTWFLTPNDTEIGGATVAGNIIAATHSVSIEDMQTGFDIRHTSATGRRQFGGSYVDPKMEALYGRMRKTIDLPAFDPADIKKVMIQQKALIGIPAEQISIAIPLTHNIRAGDVVYVQELVDSNIKGKWYVSAVSHDLSSTTGSSNMTLVKTIIEADVVDKSSIEEPLPTKTKATVAYSRLKDSNGKYVKYTGRVKMIDFSDNTQLKDALGLPASATLSKTYDGNEKVMIIASSIDMKVDAYADVYSGTNYRRAQVVGIHKGDSPFDVYLSKIVGDELGFKNNDKIELFPLEVKKPASVAGTGTVNYDGSTSSGGYDGSLVIDIITVARKYGADAVCMVATSILESGLNYHPIPGDNGSSFGPFQMHKGGALGSHTQAWAESNDTSPGSMLANRAQAFAAANAHTGADAAAVQGPANPGAYAAIVDKNLPTARQLVAQFG